jgi:hypothetical protein
MVSRSAAVDHAADPQLRAKSPHYFISNNPGSGVSIS